MYGRLHIAVIRRIGNHLTVKFYGVGGGLADGIVIISVDADDLGVEIFNGFLATIADNSVNLDDALAAKHLGAPGD